MTVSADPQVLTNILITFIAQKYKPIFFSFQFFKKEEISIEFKKSININKNHPNCLCISKLGIIKYASRGVYL